MFISKLREENAVNGVINKITEDLDKIVAVTKSKELKQYAKTFDQITKNKTIRKWKVNIKESKDKNKKLKNINKIFIT